MNENRINTEQLRILLALQNISDEAQQWKENEKAEGKRFGNRHHIRATDMDDASEEEEEEVEQSHQSEEEQLIHALKKLPKDQQINMLVNMEQDF